MHAEDTRFLVSTLAAIVVPERWTGSGSSAAAAAAAGVALPPGQRLARHIVVGAGRRLQVHEWREGRLHLIAIYDAFSLVRDLVTINDLVFFGDAHGSTRLLKWRDEDHQLLSLAADFSRAPLTATGFVVDASALGLVAADRDGNLTLSVCAPNESRLALALRCDFHLGAVVSRMARARLAVPVGTPLAERRRFATFFGTHSGSVGALLPTEEAAHKRLLTLQRVLTYCLPHAAGLNPKLWRQYASSGAPGGAPGGPGGRPRARNVLDGPLLARFLALSTHTQRHFAEAIGSSAERVLASMRELELSGSCF
jgi:cleavage and polyadenylation specificity factor subunit 1